MCDHLSQKGIIVQKHTGRRVREMRLMHLNYFSRFITFV